MTLNDDRPRWGIEKVHQKDSDEGLEALIELEKGRGYVEAQQQVTTYLSSKVWIPLWDLLAERLASISPENSVVFKSKEALDQLVREIAFTHLNRLCAYKMMEAREVYIGGQKFREAVKREEPSHPSSL